MAHGEAVAHAETDQEAGVDADGGCVPLPLDDSAEDKDALTVAVAATLCVADAERDVRGDADGGAD